VVQKLTNKNKPAPKFRGGFVFKQWAVVDFPLALFHNFVKVLARGSCRVTGRAVAQGLWKTCDRNGGCFADEVNLSNYLSSFLLGR